MSYTKQTWVTGDTITAEKLNNIENGIASGGVLVCTMDENGLLNRTWQEVVDSSFAVLMVDNDGGYRHLLLLHLWQIADNTHSVLFFNGSDEMTFTASSADDYPVYGSPGEIVE